LQRIATSCILQDIQIATLEQKTKTVTFKTSGEGKGRCVNTQVFFSWPDWTQEHCGDYSYLFRWVD